MKSDQIKAVLLDIGNVIVELDYNRSLKLLNIPLKKEEAIVEIGKWRVYEDFEKGLITTDQFINQLSKKYNIDYLSKENFIDAWNACIIGVFPGIDDLLQTASKKIKLFALSNTNEIHYQYFKKMSVFDYFERLFVSPLLQERKPDKEIYLKVLQELEFNPNEILFIDDVPENLTGARNLGIMAEHCCRSGERLATILKNYKIL